MGKVDAILEVVMMELETPVFVAEEPEGFILNLLKKLLRLTALERYREKDNA